MITGQTGTRFNDRVESHASAETRSEVWTCWPVNWTSIWVGALTAFALLLVLGLIGIAVGAHVLGSENRIVELKKWGIGALAYSVAASFFSFVAAGWVAGRVAGILRSETAMLHGAVVWVLAAPIIIVAGALGAGNFLGSWHGGLAGSPMGASAPTTTFMRPDTPLAGAAAAELEQYRNELTTYRQKVAQWNEETPKATRNSALGAVTALLLGLVGSVVGGWMASGEPMSVTYYRTRPVRVG